MLGGRAGDLAIRRRTGAMVQVGAVPQTLRVREHLELAAAWYGNPLPLSEIVRQAGLEGLEKATVRQVLRRPAAARVVRDGDRRRARASGARRAHRRARRRGATRALWTQVRGARGAGHCRSAHDPRSRRGRRSRDSGGDDPPRSHGRRRHARRGRLAGRSAAPALSHRDRSGDGPNVARRQRRRFGGRPLDHDQQGTRGGLAPALASDSQLADLEVSGRSFEDALVTLTGIETATTARATWRPHES